MFYPCIFCSETSKNMNELISHQVRAHSKITSAMECNQCQKRYFEDKLVVEHIKVDDHKEFRSIIYYKCPHCNYQIDDKRVISEHVRKTHQKKISCRQCLRRRQGLLSCNGCHTFYDNLKCLANHLALMHCRRENDERTKRLTGFKYNFVCYFCGIRANYFPYFSNHLLAFHKCQITAQGRTFCNVHPNGNEMQTFTKS